MKWISRKHPLTIARIFLKSASQAGCRPLLKQLRRLSPVRCVRPSPRVVMLGDSIVNDTGSSQYVLLRERMDPKCKVEKIRSVRGSTGCWRYKEENRGDEWVLKHAPDLLMIGGISQRDDTESIRAVIQQVRAVRPQVEILLLSPVFGGYDPRADEEWAYDADPQRDSYRGRLARPAAEEQAEFVNMTGPWGDYIRRSDTAPNQVGSWDNTGCLARSNGPVLTCT